MAIVHCYKSECKTSFLVCLKLAIEKRYKENSTRNSTSHVVSCKIYDSFVITCGKFHDNIISWTSMPIESLAFFKTVIGPRHC